MKIPFLPLKEYGSQEKHVFKYEGRNIRFDKIQATVLDVKKLLNSSTNSSHRDRLIVLTRDLPSNASLSQQYVAVLFLFQSVEPILNY